MEKFEIYGEQKTLTQWDLGRKMQVNCQCQQLHFANERADEALVCQVEEAGGVRTARIPDEVLQQSGVLWVYAFVKAEEGYTKHVQSFFVKEKPQPAGYVYTPTQWVKLEDVMTRMDALEDKAETDPTVPAWAKNAEKPAYTASEVGARPDTWLPGLADIGAAPAGYGLGEAMAQRIDHSADNIAESGLYNAWLGVPGNADSWTILACVNDANYQHQTAWRKHDGITAQRRKSNGTWGEWEWVNPPLLVGQEYRTVERWNAKPVYTQLIDFGSLPASTYKEKQFTTDYVTNVVEINAICVNEGIYRNVEKVAGVTDISVKRFSGRALVTITTDADLSNNSAFVILKYTKD